MASCKFDGGKYHTATEVKAHFRHDDISVESRKIAAKENPNIDITKSHLNKSVFGLTYEQMCEKYDNRIAELDATTNRNKRKDRATLQNIEIPVPADLPKNCYNKFFVEVTKILMDEFGRDNFIDGQIHYDEEHEYIDAKTHERVMSRVHGHFSIVPEINGQLNGKKVYTRGRMNKLNRKVDNMCQQMFGCRFMTGEKTKSKEQLDVLKTISARLQAEINQKALEEQKQLQTQNNAIEAKKGEYGAISEAVEGKQAESAELDEAISAKKAELADETAKLQKVKQANELDFGNYAANWLNKNYHQLYEVCLDDFVNSDKPQASQQSKLNYSLNV